MTLTGTPHEALNRAPAGDLSRVLVADDEPLVRRWVQRVLTDAGYEVVGVEDGQAALEELERAAYDVLLSDITMPRLNGMALLVASIERDPSVPVILMTGAPDFEVVERAEKAGVAQLLMKPMPSAAIAYAVGRCTRLRRIQQLVSSLCQGLSPAARRQVGELCLTGPGRQIPDEVPLCAELIRAIEHDKTRQPQCRLLIGLCAELRLPVTAPELRPEETTAHLRATGCQALASGELVLLHA
jgi:CheY-like chemotaxis protein